MRRDERVAGRRSGHHRQRLRKWWMRSQSPVDMESGGFAMSPIFDLGTNLAASALAFVVGVSARSALHYLQTYRSRSFWGAGVRKGKTVLCLGSFKASDLGPYMKVEEFEPTGLAGLGDAKAVHELTALLSKIGIDIHMSYADSPPAGETRDNLVLLGGDETNDLVVVAKQTGTTSNIEFQGASPIILYDQFTRTSYKTQWEMGRITVDYGRFIRKGNPYNPDRTLVMISGIYGFGTWGGVRLLNDKDFLRKCAALEVFDMECIFEVRVIHGEPEIVRPIAIRPLNATPP